MIDNFALAISHGLILLTAWRLLQRPDLDSENAPPLPASPQAQGRFRRVLKGRHRA